MTKEEAIQSMKEGNKVTHEYFCDDEYIFMQNNGHIYDEEGNKMTGGDTFDFWTDRKSEAWQTEWTIYESKK